MTTEKMTAITTPVRVRPPEDAERMEAIAVQPRNPGEMMVLAIQHNADPAVLQKLLDIQREWDAMQARKAYVEAMTEFKRECPSVLRRDATVDFSTAKGRTHYTHATLGGIVTAITPLLSKNGLSIGWETDQGQNTVSVTCHVTHRAGHRESTKLVGPRDESGNKNMIQAVGSAVTYLQRYTLLSALGLATSDQDDDGFAADMANRNGKASAASVALGKKSTPPAPVESGAEQGPTSLPKVQGLVEEVSEKHGEGKKGPWTKYGIKVKGEWYGTFDTKHGKIAADAKAAGVPVDIAWVQDGKYRNAISVVTIAVNEGLAPQEDRQALIDRLIVAMTEAPKGTIARALDNAGCTTTDWQELDTPELISLLAEINAA